MDEIRHRGVISGISPGSIQVTIISESACSGCHAQGMCNASDQKEKMIEVTSPGKQFSTGQPVTVVMRATSGLKALLLGYIFPFLILLSVLIILVTITGNEILSGLVSLVSLIPYYILLYHFRDKLKTTFRFYLEE
jgi:positive regulator of sigma E activity